MKRHSLAFAAALICTCAPSAAFAQANGSSRAYQGLFGGGGGNDPAVHHKLDVSFSVVAAYDDDQLPALSGGIDPTTRPFSGYNTTYTGTGQYAWTGRRMQVGLTATSALRQYIEFNDYNMTHAVGAGFAMQFARRTTLLVNQSASYSPPYLFGLFPSVDTVEPGSVIAGGPNYVIDDSESFSYETTATVDHGLSRRGTISTTADYRYTDFTNNTLGKPDVRSSGIRGHYAYSFGRNTSWTAGYHYRSGQLGFGTTAVTAEQGIDIGMEYTKRLSPSRRATFNFTVGSSRMDLPAVPAAGIVGGLHSDVSADISVNYQFNRSWLARGAYRRGAEFVAELSEPIYADGVTFTLNGDLTRRLRLVTAAAYSSGSTLQPGNAPNLTTYTANLQLGYQLTESLGTYAEYLYYFYDFAGNPLLAPGLLTSVERNGARVGLTYFFTVRRR